MRITIFGATGGTGKHIVQMALDAGHEVTAFVRSPEKLSIDEPNLTVVQGDVHDAGAVEQAVAGSDAVFSALANSPKAPTKDVQTVGTQHIIAAMRKHGVTRLISTTGAGVRFPEDEPGMPDQIIRFLLKTLNGKVLEDAQRHTDLIVDTDLEWTIIRAPMLTDGPHTGDYRVGWVGVNTGPRLNRADFADFVLDVAEDGSYVHKAPVVSN
ncbi:MAG: NAD(P)-dependent oxidoreductase [Anaerolineae bacterium]